MIWRIGMNCLHLSLQARALARMEEGVSGTIVRDFIGLLVGIYSGIPYPTEGAPFGLFFVGRLMIAGLPSGLLRA